MGILLGVVLFGSVARGDDDKLSDLDVLALVQNGAGVVSYSEVLMKLPTHLAKRVATISWYGADRYNAMHEAGELFCWHIYLDGQVLFDPIGILGALGRPAHYQRSLTDVDAFIEIAADLPSQLSHAACNAVYEMGILYVCVRNVAMSCSSDLTGKPDFTRMAPYRLADAPRLGVPEDEYRLSMLCRLAGQRGLPLPDGITPSRVVRYHDVAFAWMLAVRALLERKMNDG